MVKYVYALPYVFTDVLVSSGVYCAVTASGICTRVYVDTVKGVLHDAGAVYTTGMA